MTVKEIEFERRHLKHKNYKDRCHIYKSMTTTADIPETEIPESVIRVLYRIFIEAVSEGVENDKQP